MSLEKKDEEEVVWPTILARKRLLKSQTENIDPRHIFAHTRRLLPSKLLSFLVSWPVRESRNKASYLGGQNQSDYLRKLWSNSICLQNVGRRKRLSNCCFSTFKEENITNHLSFTSSNSIEGKFRLWYLREKCKPEMFRENPNN